MILLKGKVLSILPIRSVRSGQTLTTWRISLSYDGPESVYEVELTEPWKELAVKKTTIALNGSVEFDLTEDPGISAGESISLAAYQPGER